MKRCVYTHTHTLPFVAVKIINGCFELYGLDHFTGSQRVEVNTRVRMAGAAKEQRKEIQTSCIYKI